MRTGTFHRFADTKPVISLDQNMRFASSFDKNFSGDVCGNATVYGLSTSSHCSPMSLASCIAPVAAKQIYRLLSVQKITNVSADAGGD
jgi:hypothetical protein